MSLKMSRLEIVGLKNDLPKVVRILHGLGCVHIDEVTEAPDVSARPLTLTRETLRTQEELSLLVARIEGLHEELGCEAEQSAPHPPEEILEEARPGVAELAPKVQAIAARRQQLEDELSSLPRYEATLRKLLPLIPESAGDPHNKTVGVVVSREHQGVLESLGDRVLNLSAGRAEIVATDLDAATRAMLLVFPVEFAGEVEELLDREDVSRLRLPSEIGQGPPDTAFAALRKRMTEIPDEIQALEAQTQDLRTAWQSRLNLWRDVLKDELARYDVLPSLGETDLTFVLVGWAPTRDLDKLRQALKDKMGETVAVNELPITRELRKQVPIALSNPKPIRPFETLIRMLTLPRHGELDPAGLMAIFMPMIFGMILGDIAYGALLLLIALFMMRKIKQGMMRDLLIVIATGGAWAIVFGFLYGEFLGTLGEEIGLHALWIDRADPHHVQSLLLFTIGVGAIHILLGLILGVYEAIKHKSRNHLLERGGMLVGLIGLFLMVGVMVDFLPQGFMTPGVAALIVGIVLVGTALGCLGVLMGPIEFIGLIGNILSYLRIAAIGLASVYLAKVANEMAGSFGNIIVGGIVALLIHALNLVLGAFSPTIHSLRLHYVEFFRKFYEGGGRAYEPFKSEYLSAD
jgi:V/A-type H+-transporting ATPase subunit I